MIESLVEFETPAGRMDAFVTHPESGGPFPAVVILMDIWGLREELFDIARRVATVGYYCIVPNFYYRQGKVAFALHDQAGRMLSFERIPADVQQRIRSQMRLLNDDMAMADLGAVLDFLRTQAVRPGAKGAIGYCLGGRYAFQASAQYPEDFRACASLHGTRLASDAAHSPHRLAPRCRGEIYCGFGERDEFAAPAIRAALEQAFASCPDVRYRPMLHTGALHGYALPDRDVYDKHAANRDWENIFAMFRRTFGS
jgi:carboxymethylenebutenolidase